MLVYNKIFQKTIKKSFSIKGFGVHLNQKSNLIFHPADADFGIQFKISRSSQKAYIKANINSVCKSKYQLSLGNNFYVVHTVEHILSALYGLGITNCLIEIEGDEVPILDGSSNQYVEMILKKGFVEQEIPLNIRYIPGVIELSKKNRYIIALPNNSLEINYLIKYNHPLLEREIYRFSFSEDNYITELSKARTFGFLSEWESMKTNGYGLGSSTHNTVVFDTYSLKNPPLRYPNECVRHKILDFIAALSLLEYRVQGVFYIYCSGHDLDIDFVKKLNSVLINEADIKTEQDILKHHDVIHRLKHDFGYTAYA